MTWGDPRTGDELKEFGAWNPLKLPIILKVMPPYELLCVSTDLQSQDVKGHATYPGSCTHKTFVDHFLTEAHCFKYLSSLHMESIIVCILYQ